MKDKQFVEEIERELFKWCYDNDVKVHVDRVEEVIATIIKRSFAHRDEAWREQLEVMYPPELKENSPEIYGEKRKVAYTKGYLVAQEDALSLFTDKETKV